MPKNSTIVTNHITVKKCGRLLELRQYKNGLVSVKYMFVLKLPPFFPHLHGKGKRAAISRQTCVSQKRIRSYIVLALVSCKVAWVSEDFSCHRFRTSLNLSQGFLTDSIFCCAYLAVFPCSCKEIFAQPD